MADRVIKETGAGQKEPAQKAHDLSDETLYKCAQHTVYVSAQQTYWSLLVCVTSVTS